MFGWIVANGSKRCHLCLAPTDMSQSVRRIDAREVLDWLPTLGNVLWVHGPRGVTRGCPPGWVLSGPSLAALADATWLMSSCAITEDGPREWCQCLDSQGRVLGRFHLLPDTDYVAWDALAAVSDAGLIPPTLQVAGAFRPTGAAVVCFRLCRLAGLKMLEPEEPESPRSPLSCRVARQLARTESVALS